MSKPIDLTGQRFGRLTVIKMVGNVKTKNGKSKSQCLCECECGNIFKTKSSNLRKENDKRGIKQCEECSLNKKNISFPKK